MDVQTILGQIDLGAIALPEFQRGYVWSRDQVPGAIRGGRMSMTRPRSGAERVTGARTAAMDELKYRASR